MKTWRMKSSYCVRTRRSDIRADDSAQVGYVVSTGLVVPVRTITQPS